MSETRPIEQLLLHEVIASLTPMGEDGDLDTHDDLLSFLDSLQILRMVVTLEKMFTIKIGNEELTADNVGSVAKLAKFIVDKRGAVA